LGKRMNAKISKPFIPIYGKPIIAYTLEKFEQCKFIEGVYLIVNQRERDLYKKNVISKYNFSKVKRLIDGGRTRQNSVYNGLKSLDEDTDIVVIHDGARPFIEETLIQSSVKAAQKYGAAILAIPIKDTIKKSRKYRFIKETIDREHVWRAQTPQTFRYDLIFSSYKKAYQDKLYVTDDAAIVEKYGHKVKIVIGSEENIKVTTPFDIVIAENLLKERLLF